MVVKKVYTQNYPSTVTIDQKKKKKKDSNAEYSKIILLETFYEKQYQREISFKKFRCQRKVGKRRTEKYPSKISSPRFVTLNPPRIVFHSRQDSTALKDTR